MRQFFTCLFSLICLTSIFVQEADAQRRRPKQDKNAFALIEFFTSEACLRCRDSSALAAKVVKSSGGELSRVFLLAFHVDYLNSLSWRDPYSDKAFSKRQEEYMRKIRGGAMVPGSFIVNGRKYLGTTSPIVMQRAVLEAKKIRPRADIELEFSKSEDPKLVIVKYRVKGLGSMRRPFFLLHLAATQDEIKKTIADGVNAGQEFTHVNLVHNFQSRRIDTTGKDQVQGEIEVVLPIELDKDDLDYTAFVQDPRTLHVIGAEQLQNSEERK